jgi:type VI secretion system protein ImpA
LDDRLAIAELIAALPDGVGPDLRAGGPGSELYLAIKDARADARRAERDAVQSGDPEADPLRAGLKPWSEVATGARQLLATLSKDLQAAAWLCEAWLRTEGFPGLAAGFELLAELAERYWDAGLHPEPDEEGEQTRIGPLLALFGRGDNGTLLQPLKLLPLTDGNTPLALWTVETVLAQSTRHDDPEVREQLVERRNERLQAIDDAIARASADFAATATAAIERAIVALDRLMVFLDAHTATGRFGSQVAKPLADAQALLRRREPEAMRAPAMAAAPGQPDPDPSGAPSIATATPGHPATRGPIHDRASALATLLEVAAFFDRNEPQSLVGHSVREVVRRANMPLEALLAELLPDADQRALYLQRAGIRPDQGGGSTTSDDIPTTYY